MGIAERNIELTGQFRYDDVTSAVMRAAPQDLLHTRTLQLAPDAWEDFLIALNEPNTEAMAALRTRATRWDT
ncbi:MAG: DUF1778 domain-containing protein [Propionibacteriaceae bacterium]|jgi:uncharacterized protein (DUF1778 family)|nr:DUF1778 domain-containing protein [Propionibacteriaceae bacterium]